jgi:hypothetical protein
MELFMKTRNLIGVALLSVIFLVCTAQSYAASNQEIAVQFFPDNLKASVLKEFGKKKPVNLEDYVMTMPADLDGIGKANYLVCVYSDRAHGALRVIKNDGPIPVLAAEASQVSLYGVRGGPTLVDLDNDKKPEIVVEFMSARGNATTWIFKWTGSALRLISPVADDSTELGTVEFLDLTGNGTLSVVTDQPTIMPRDDNGNPIFVPTQAYTLGPNGLTLSASFKFQRQLQRKTGAPQEKNVTFTIADSNKPYVLKVFDLNMSKPDLGPLLSSVTVTLNGAQIVGPNAFKVGVRNKVLSFPVQLKSSNQLTLKLAGAPGSKMLVTVSEAN